MMGWPMVFLGICPVGFSSPVAPAVASLTASLVKAMDSAAKLASMP